MSRRQRAAHRLWRGSILLAQRTADRAVGWVRKGPSRAHRIVRALLLIVGLYYGARIVRAAPVIMWVVTTLWTWRSWRIGRGLADEPEETLAEEPTTSARDAVVALLLECLGDRPAVHLSTVLAHLQEKGQCEGWTVADLRARLEALGIPVQRKVKVRGIPTRGVRRADLTALSPDAGAPASPTEVDAD